ncbi:hypothetical protein [Altererythrobacter aquiaggeris]|uniref:hypothetical protein n=1 Tax=Aestuarierythrobacter aquiaggeris TaxID=1898396 RepID=UPI0030158AEB
MKKFLLISAVAALAACSPAETTTEADTPVATAEPAAPTATTAADGGPSTGTYKITRADGTVIMEEIRADGTWTGTSEGEEPTTGTWEQKSPELFCSTDDEAGAVQKCYTESIDENGVWTSVDPDGGEVSTVERVEA